MKMHDRTAAVAVVALALVAGCASTEIKNKPLVTGKLPRPEQIHVYDFAATSSEVPADSDLSADVRQPAAQTAEQIAAGKQLGADMAAELIKRINGMGLKAVRGTNETRPRLNDGVMRGYLLGIDEGSTAKRMVIGFGAGTAELKTVVEGFQMTASGLRKIGSGTLDSGGSKGPGAAAPAAVAVATGNPIGLIVSSGVKVYGEASGKARIEGRAADTVDEISARLEKRFKEFGWID